MSNIREYSESLELNIIGETDGQHASATFENLHFNENLNNKKITVDFGYFGNRDLPTFIPDKLNALYTYSPAPTFIYGNTMDVDSIDYVIRMKKIVSNVVTQTSVTYVKWINEIGLTPPPTIASTQQDFMIDKYYWSYSTLWFSQIVSSSIIQTLISNGWTIPTPTAQIVVGSSSFGLIIDSVILHDVPNSTRIEFEFSENLNKLFRLQSIKSTDGFEKLIFGLNTITYASVSARTCNGLGWSIEWFPFNQVLIQSDLNIKKIEEQNNIVSTTSFYTTKYKAVVLQFSITPENPNAIYSYFEYITQSANTKYTYFDNDIDLKQQFEIRIYLYNIVKNVLIPYTLKKGEYVNLKLRILTSK